MSTSRSFGYGGNKNYTNVFKQQSVWCNFIVDSANGNGLGIRSLKSNGYIESVFMYTSTTPGVASNGVTNPITVAGGNCLVTFKNNFNYYLGGFTGQIPVPTSTSTTSTTAGHAYLITALGTATAAQWTAAGVPNGMVPQIGTAFIAKATGTIGGSAHVGLPGVPLATGLIVVGDPNTTAYNSNIQANAGAQLLLQFSKPTDSSTTTMVSAAPADNTVVGMWFGYDCNGGSNTIDGL